MKKIFSVIFLLLLSGTLTIAQEKKSSKKVQKALPSVTGYLVDQMCGKRMVMDDIKKSDAKASRHTKDCALDEHCSAHGYGLVTGGTFLKFDASGDIQAKEFLKTTLKEDSIKVIVVGTFDGEKLNVQSIKDISRPTKKRSKK